MAYVKNIWVDQEVERPRTYQKIDNADGSFTLIDDFGLVSELGTPVNADNMNHIEEGIEAGSFTKYDGSVTYFKNDLVTSFLDEDLVIYKSLKDNNIGNPLTDANYWEEIKLGGGAGQPIGTIYPLTCTKDYVPEGSLPCDGTEYTKAQFSDLWDNYITTALLNTCTYDEYATDLATYGQCGKFAVDTTNNKFKVPTIKDGAVIQQALSDMELGKAYNAGLPNITGGFLGETELTDEKGLYWDGAFTYTTINKYRNGSTSGRSTAEGEFDASLANPIYGNSDTVQMNAVALRHFVVVANGSINQSQMDWSEWASNLQAKANKDGTNWEASVKNIDGQWVSKAAILTQAVTAGVTTIDMSEYLPKDNYQYEVLILASIGDTGTNILRVYSDVIPVSTLGLDIAANGLYNGSYITLPVGIGRKIYQSLAATAVSDNYRGIEALAYRRLGTNQ